MESNTPFSQSALNEIFKISPTDPDRVISRESSTLEFKESFGWTSLPKYMKTLVAYANTKGGYIVFGVASKPHRLVGLSGAKRKLFEDIDPEKMSQNFNEYFAPEIKWDIQEYVLEEKSFGLLYVHEVLDKPVMCTKNAGQELKEGDIYYRYRGRTERIRFPELRAIMDARRTMEQRFWMKHLESIARIGVREAGIFDLQTGQITGGGGTFVIDESLLGQLAFIREGEFSEVKGKPTLRLIGQVESLTAGEGGGIQTRKILKTKGIRTSDIVLSFLNHDNVPEPDEYFKQICFDSTAFLPVYYFIEKAGITRGEALTQLERLVTRSQSRSKLIDRLENKKTQFLPIPQANTSAAECKRDFAMALRKKKVDESISGQDLVYCLQAMRGLTEKQVKGRSRYLRRLLKKWFNAHYVTADSSVADNLRRTICWIDEALYMDKFNSAEDT